MEYFLILLSISGYLFVLAKIIYKGNANGILIQAFLLGAITGYSTALNSTSNIVFINYISMGTLSLITAIIIKLYYIKNN